MGETATPAPRSTQTAADKLSAEPTGRRNAMRRSSPRRGAIPPTVAAKRRRATARQPVPQENVTRASGHPCCEPDPALIISHAYNKRDLRLTAASPSRELAFALHDVARMLRTYSDHRAREVHMTRAQWAVLSKLRRSEGLKQCELADMLDLAPITLARLIDKLDRLGPGRAARGRRRPPRQPPLSDCRRRRRRSSASTSSARTCSAARSTASTKRRSPTCERVSSRSAPISSTN